MLQSALFKSRIMLFTAASVLITPQIIFAATPPRYW